MSINSLESEILAPYRIMVETVAQNMSRAPWIVAGALATTIQEKRADPWFGTRELAVASLRVLEARYAPHLHASRAAHWLDSDGLSSLRVCQFCFENLYAPLVLEYCPLCEKWLNKDIIGLALFKDALEAPPS